MMLCLVNNQQNLCGYENKQFYMCKRERDAAVFARIREWDLARVAGMAGPEAVKEVETLEMERKEVAERFGKTAASIGNKHRRWRMAADIEQLKWRIDYLKESMKGKTE
jgi:hypothetical protein